MTSPPRRRWIVRHPAYSVPLPTGHRFPMPKFAALIAHLEASGLATAEQFAEPVLAPRAWLGLAHDPSYVDRVLGAALSREEERRLGLPMSEALALRARAATGGTVLAARLALESGIAANTAGGSHHAFVDAAAGFCVFNDVAVAVRVLRTEGLVRRVLVIDLDVHQGDGTAAILAGDPEVTTFSVHCRSNFPARKRQSTLDVALDAGVGDPLYLATLSTLLPLLFDRTRPELVLYNAGVDPHVADRLGRLELTDTGLEARERLVLSTCRDRRVPVAIVVGGGYDDDLDALVRRHAIVHRVARDLYGT